jgi:hypothetical protein
MKRLFPLLFALMLISSAKAEFYNVTTPGTLPTLIDAAAKDTITSLEIEGKINGTDIKFIREMAGRDSQGNATNGKLTELYLSAEIASGGEAYYKNNVTADYTISANMLRETNLIYVELPNATAIGDSAFYAAKSLEWAYISDEANMKSLGKSAFEGCEKLNYLDENILNKLITIGAKAFKGCALTDMALSKSLTTIGEEAFRGNQISDWIIPDAVTSIGKGCFAEDTCVYRVTLSENLREIGDSAFANCSALEEIYSPAATPLVLADSTFAGVKTDSCELVVPVKSEEAYKSAKVWRNFKIQTEEMDSMTVTNAAAGELYKQGISKLVKKLTVKGPINGTDIKKMLNLNKDFRLVDIDLSGSRIVEGGDAYYQSYFTVDDEVGEDMFMSTTFEHIALPDSVQAIRNFAFNGSIKLKSVDMPVNLRMIGDAAFGDCSSLQTINIPARVTSLGRNVFWFSGVETINVDNDNVNYASADGVLFDKNVTKLLQYPIGNKRSDYTLPSAVDTIGKNSFSNSKYLKNIDFSKAKNLTSIEESAFYVNVLRSITIPASVKTIGRAVFAYSDSMTSINVDAANANYASRNGALLSKDLTTLCVIPGGVGTSFDVPEGVKTISEEAGYNNTMLTRLNLPATLDSIGGYAFWSTTLAEVHCKSVTPPATGESVFGDGTINSTLYVPTGSLTDYQTATTWKDFASIVADPTGIKAVESNGVKVRVTANGGEITVTGATAGTQISVYTLSGSLAASTRGNGESITLPAMGNGLYIVKVGNTSHKVIIRN